MSPRGYTRLVSSAACHILLWHAGVNLFDKAVAVYVAVGERNIYEVALTGLEAVIKRGGNLGIGDISADKVCE